METRKSITTLIYVVVIIVFALDILNPCVEAEENNNNNNNRNSNNNGNNNRSNNSNGNSIDNSGGGSSNNNNNNNNRGNNNGNNIINNRGNTNNSNNGNINNNSCMNELAPCFNYLNGNQEPPDSCCDPLKSIIKNNPKCLCSMITNQGSRQAEQAGININEAQTLPGRCGQHVNPLSCLKAVSPSPSGGSNNKNSDTNTRGSNSYNNNDDDRGSSSGSVCHHAFDCWMNIAATVVSPFVFRYYF